MNKLWNMKVTIIPIVIGAFGTVAKKTVTRTEGSGNNGTSGDCPNYSIVEIGQNTEKSPGDSRGLAVTQTPEKKDQLMLMLKTLKEWNNYKNKSTRKRTCRIVDLAILADPWVKLKKAKIRISTRTMQENWKKNCGTWK